MRSSARNLVNSVSPIGSGSSTRLTARRSSVGVTRTGEFTLRWKLPGALRSRSSPLLRCDAAGGRPEAAVLSSRPGHARRPNRSASKSAPLRCWLMLGSMLWTTRPEPVSHRVWPAHPQAPSRSSSLFVAKSMRSWPSAATFGITRHGFFSSRKRAAVSPIEPEDMRAIKAVACTPTPTCTVSCSPRSSIRRAPDRRLRARVRGSGERRRPRPRTIGRPDPQPVPMCAAARWLGVAQHRVVAWLRPLACRRVPLV
jgi:hypothetical protein